MYTRYSPGDSIRDLNLRNHPPSWRSLICILYIYIFITNQKTCARCIFVSSSFSKGTKNGLNGWSPAIWRLLPGDASGSGGVEQPPETKDPLVFLKVGKMGSAWLSLVVFASGLKTVLTNCACLYTLMTYSPTKCTSLNDQPARLTESYAQKDWIRFQGCCAAHLNQCSQCCLLFLGWLLGLYPHSRQPLARRWRARLHLSWHLCYVVCCPGLVTFQRLGGVSSDHTLWNSCGLSKQRWPRAEAGTSPL